MNKQTFAKLIRDGRAKFGLSLMEIASIVKTAPGTVSRWENGHCAPPVSVRKKLIQVLFPEE